MATIALLGSSIAGTSSTYFFNTSNFSSRAFQATVQGTGAVTADVTVTVSNDNIGFVPFAVFNLSGSGVVSEGQESFAPWTYIRVSLDTISGVGATATVSMGI
jgi:hypothetical protein